MVISNIFLRQVKAEGARDVTLLGNHRLSSGQKELSARGTALHGRLLN